MRKTVPATGDTEALRTRFIAEAIAATDTKGTYWAAYESLREWLYALAPFSRRDDFQFEGEIELPEPHRILMEPSILYGYYRAWLRWYGAAYLSCVRSAQ
jgi:hypothetical protein